MRFASVFLLTAGITLAQTGTGNIQGTVRDATTAVVPNAKVTVVHTATTREYTSQTNEVGFYIFPAMQSGAYQISVEFAGMETWKGGLTLVAGQQAAVEIVLKPGATATSVTVAGDVTPMLTTTSATIATVVERQRIEQLPLNGRFITTLLGLTTPGEEVCEVARKVIFKPCCCCEFSRLSEMTCNPVRSSPTFNCCDSRTVIRLQTIPSFVLTMR